MSELRLSDLQASYPEMRGFVWRAGTYRMVVDAARKTKTRGGKMKIIVTFLCTAGPLKGHAFTWDLVCDPNNPRYFLERLLTLGCAGEFYEADPLLDDVCTHIVGPQEYLVTFKDSEFNGRPTTKISYLERV